MVLNKGDSVRVILNTFISDKRNLISLNDFSAGVYFVQIRTASETVVRRIIKN